MAKSKVVLPKVDRVPVSSLNLQDATLVPPELARELYPVSDGIPPPPEVAAMAKAAPQDELRSAQKESDLLRFLSTQGRGFDEAGRIIAGIPGSMQIDLAGTDKPVQHVQQRQAEAYKVAQAEAEKQADVAAKAEKARLEKKADERYEAEVKRKAEEAEKGRKTQLQAAAIQGRGKDEAARVAASNEEFDREQGLRKEYDSHPDVKEYRQTSGSYSRLKKAAAQPSAAGDVAIIFHYMKMLDPGVSVMADDIKNARQTANIPDQIWGYFERARTGESLSPAQRAGFLQQAENLMADSQGRFDAVNERYRGIAQSAGVAPERVAQPSGTGGGDTVTIQAMKDGQPVGEPMTLPRANLQKAQERAASQGMTLQVR